MHYLSEIIVTADFWAYHFKLRNRCLFRCSYIFRILILICWRTVAFLSDEAPQQQQQQPTRKSDNDSSSEEESSGAAPASPANIRCAPLFFLWIIVLDLQWCSREDSNRCSSTFSSDLYQLEKNQTGLSKSPLPFVLGTNSIDCGTQFVGFWQWLRCQSPCSSLFYFAAFSV